jgi:hypothetical protein
MPTKVSEAVALAQQISELKRKLKLLEKEMSLKEFIEYVDGTRVIPSDQYQSAGISGNNKPEPRNEKVLVGKKA